MFVSALNFWHLYACLHAAVALWFVHVVLVMKSYPCDMRISHRISGMILPERSANAVDGGVRESCGRALIRHVHAWLSSLRQRTDSKILNSRPYNGFLLPVLPHSCFLPYFYGSGPETRPVETDNGDCLETTENGRPDQGSHSSTVCLGDVFSAILANSIDSTVVLYYLC